MNFPDCHSRIEIRHEANRQFCSHPSVVAGDGLVGAGICKMCRFRTLPPPEKPRSVPRHLVPLSEVGACLFRGNAIDGAEKTFQCRHPNHFLATDLGCYECEDYELPLRCGPGAVKTWAVGVTTAPRKVPLLARTLESMANAGWTNAYVFAEPDSPPNGLREGDVWCQRSRRLGAYPNWYLSLTELVLREPYADAYFLCQDDVAFCKDVRAYLEKILWPTDKPHLVSIYCATVTSSGVGRGLCPLAEDELPPGALTYLFPKAVARALLSDSQLIRHRLNGPVSGTAGIDMAVGEWCRRREVAYYAHIPSLAGHLGEQSSMWIDPLPSPRREAASFAGEETTAFSFLK